MKCRPFAAASVLQVGAIFFACCVSANAATLWWDGGTDSILTDGDGASAGGSGTWDTTLLNWDAGDSEHFNWDNEYLDTASFGGTAGTVTLGVPISANKLDFPAISNYIITDSTLTLAGGTPTINHAGITTINSVIDGMDGLKITGANNLILGSANTYSGDTVLGGGNLVLSADDGINNTGTFYFGDIDSANVVLGLTVNGNAAVGGLTARMRNATASTISIASGKTLTVNGDFSVRGNSASTIQSKLTVSGSGTLAVSKTGGTMRIGNTSSYNGAILDMSGLSTCTASLGSTGKFFVGANTSSNSSAAGQDCTLTLAVDSTITAGTLAISDHDQASAGPTNTLKLGSGTNVLNVNNIYLGAYETTGNITRGPKAVIQFFNANGTVTIRDAAGSGRANLEVGTMARDYGSIVGTVDLSGHTADLLLGSLKIGNFTSSTTNAAYFATGTMSFSLGTLDVTSVLLGHKNGSVTTGTLNIGGGTTTVGTGGIVIGSNGGTGTLNLTGGTVTLGGNITRNVATSSGTLTLDGATLNMGGFNIGGTTAMSAINFNSGTLKNVGQINNGSTGLTKATAGTLILEGTNTYTGTTLVSEGCLIIDTPASIPNNGTGVTVAAGAGFGVNAANFSDAKINTLVANVTWDAGGTSKLVLDTEGGTVTVGSNFNGIGFNILAKGGGTVNLTGNVTGVTITDDGSTTVNIGAGPVGATKITVASITTSVGTTPSTLKATIVFTADGKVDVYSSDDLATWGLPIATGVAASPVVIDNLAGAKKFFVLVTEGATYPPAP